MPLVSRALQRRLPQQMCPTQFRAQHGAWWSQKMWEAAWMESLLRRVLVWPWPCSASVWGGDCHMFRGAARVFNVWVCLPSLSLRLRRQPFIPVFARARAQPG
eukprot:gene16495-biopygen2250